jgi:hypothetical protein
MTFPLQVQTVLNHLNLIHLKPIGRGGEGWVFPNTSDTVLKVYLDTNENRLKSRQHIFFNSSKAISTPSLNLAKSMSRNTLSEISFQTKMRSPHQPGQTISSKNSTNVFRSLEAVSNATYPLSMPAFKT